MEPLQRALAASEGSFLVTLAAALGLVAGVLHLIVTPMHFGEHVAQGLFMVVLGTLQVVWGLAFFRRASAGGFVAGVALALGAILVWVAATLVRAPYSAGAETPEPIAWCTEAVQALTVVVLVVLALRARPLGASAGRALPLVVAALVLGLIAGGGAYGAGLVGEKVAPALGEGAGEPMGEHAAGADEGATTPMSMPDHGAGANQSATNATNSTSSFDPASCMRGMDMPGCTAAQAESYYQSQKGGTASAPPPDKDLDPVKIALDAQGSNPSGKATLDAGTMQLLVTVFLNDTGPGPYAAFGPGGSGDLKIDFKGPNGTKSMTLGGSGGLVGADPASPLAKTFTTTISMPDAGAYTVSVAGQGQNVQLTIRLTERFTM